MGIKRNVFISAIILPVFIFILHGCAPAYVPNAVNTPLLSNAGEFHASLATGTSGIDPQIALGITDHFGIMINGSFANRTSDSTDDFHKHQFIEMAPGYYTNFEKNGRFEIYGGYGIGKIQAEFDNIFWRSYSNVSYYRIFIQPSIGFTSDYAEGSLAARIVMLNISQEHNQNTGYFVEPAATIKFGAKPVKMYIQLGFSLPVNTSKVEFNYQPFMFSFGVQGSLGRKEAK